MTMDAFVKVDLGDVVLRHERPLRVVDEFDAFGFEILDHGLDVRDPEMGQRGARSWWAAA